MGNIGKLVLGFLGLCILLPGLCFFAFGILFLGNLPASVPLVLVWFGIGALLTWAAVAIFRQIGK